MGDGFSEIEIDLDSAGGRMVESLQGRIMKRLMIVWIGLGVAILWAVFAPMMFAAEQTVITGNAGLFVPVTPCRMVDTRVASQYPAGYGAPNVPPGTTRTFHITTGQIVSGQFGCGIPVGALGISATFTVDNLDTFPTYFAAVKWGDLRAYPSGGPTPFVSVLNWTHLTGAIADAALVPLSPGGDITVQVDGFGTYGADVIIDINGYFVPGQLASAAPIGGFGGCGQQTSPLPAWAKCQGTVTDSRIKSGMVFGTTYTSRLADDQIPVKITNIHDGGFSFEIQTGTSFMYFGGAP
jgi:hypothetical protein